MNSLELEKKSSAISLSDMEMFIFPELVYSLVLANIMSPILWAWRSDPWFEGIEAMKPTRKLNRIKQYIMDNYMFNLDLETWGLTSQERELARFSDFIDPEMLARSNALFGYEGDKYYFDMDIRSHFGLDKYGSETIPYWKTETVEAMDAFRHKDGYTTGAGECVSLATMYAAALFVVGRIPLGQIYLMATPLHSQNFIDIGEGVLTNNRRLVTKNMWFNGTALSAKARRALEKERITIVAHESGFIHTVYEEASISREAFENFSSKLGDFLKTGLTPELLGNFLRHRTDLQKCFLLRHVIHGHDHYVEVETVFRYESGSPYKLTDNTRDKLIGSIDQEEFTHCRRSGKLVVNDLEDFVKNEKINLCDDSDYERLRREFASDCLNAQLAISELRKFAHGRPDLPDFSSKKPVPFATPLKLDVSMAREEVIEHINSIRDKNTYAYYAAYAYRDLSQTEPEPFLKAAIERNPVCCTESEGLEPDALLEKFRQMPDESIYPSPVRLAQPDEVWNFGRGDGIEKALVFAAILRGRKIREEMRLQVSGESAILHVGGDFYTFPTAKALAGSGWAIPQLPGD